MKGCFSLLSVFEHVRELSWRVLISCTIKAISQIPTSRSGCPLLQSWKIYSYQAGVSYDLIPVIQAEHLFIISLLDSCYKGSLKTIRTVTTIMVDSKTMLWADSHLTKDLKRYHVAGKYPRRTIKLGQSRVHPCYLIRLDFASQITLSLIY